MTDQLVDLVPDSTLLSTGFNIEAGNGASVPGTHHAALADEIPPTTYIDGSTPWTRIFDVASVVPGDYRCTMNSYTLAANERCRRVRVHCIANGRAAQYMFGLGNGAVTDERLGRIELYPLPDGADLNQWIVGPWANFAQDGSGNPTLEWTQTNINDLRARITPVAAHFLGTGYFYKLRVQLDILSKPVPHFIEPVAEQVFPTRDPTLRWTVDSSAPQKKFQLKIFPAAIVEDAGFNILTSTAAIYVAAGNTSGQSHRVTKMSSISLPTGGGMGSITQDFTLEHGKRYYAFIRTAIDFNGQDWWSDWPVGTPFKINSKPMVTVMGPLSPVVDTAKPTITWDYEDEEGDIQSAVRIIVIQKTTVTWPGDLDPEEEAMNGNAVYDSGVMSTEALDFDLPVALENGKSFRAYVQVRQRVPSVLDSDWSYITFDTTFAAPLTPSLTAQAVDTSAEIRVIPALSNLLTADSSSFETATGDWIAGTSTAISRVTSQFLHGAASLQVQRTGTTGTAQAFSDQLADVCVPVVPGQVVSAFVWVKAGTTGRTTILALEMINGSNTVVSTQNGSPVTDTTTGWTKAFVTAVVPASPAGIVKARLKLEFSSAVAGENHFVDQAMVYSGSDSQEIPFDLGGGTTMATISPDTGARTVVRNWLTRHQSGLEDAAAGVTGWVNQAGTTITRSTTQAREGLASLRLERASSTGDAVAFTTAFPNAIPVTGGEEITVAARFRAGTTGRSCSVNILFFDSGGGLLPAVLLENITATDSNANFDTIAKARTNVPMNATMVSMVVQASAVPVGEFHYVDEMIVFKGDTDVWSVGDAKSLAFTDCQLIIGEALLDWLPEEEAILWDIWDYVTNKQCVARLILQTDGKLRWEWSTNGTEGLKKTAISTAAIPAWAGSSLNFIKVQFDNDNGAAGQNVKFFQGATETTATTAIGATVTVATVEAPYQGWSIEHISGQGFSAGGWQGYAYFVELRDDQTGAGNVLSKTYFQFPNVTTWRDQGQFGGRLWELAGPSDEMTAEMEVREEPNPDYLEIMRSRDGGTTWEYFRYDEGLLSDRVPKAMIPFTIMDHEVHLNKSILYRVASGYTGLGFDAQSQWSANASVTVVGKKVTLKCTMDPTLSRSFPVADDWLQINRKKERRFYQPIGRRNPIIIKGFGGSDSFSILFTLRTQAEFDAMQALLDMHHTMIFVQTPKGSWWTEVATDVQFRAHLWDALHGEDDVYQLAIPFQEVDRLDANNVASHT